MLRIKSKKPKNWTYWKNKLDKEMGALIREKAVCERCGAVHVKFDWAHVVGRANKTLRWDIMNAMCLCFHCHLWWHEHPLESAKWFQKKFPHRYFYLMQTKDIITKRKEEDYILLLDAIKQKKLQSLMALTFE